MILRCTKKVLGLLGVQPAAFCDPPPNDDDWYLNLMWIDHRKCLLLVHAGTLFPVFVSDVRKAELHDVGRYLVALVEAALRSENIAEDGLGRLDPGAVQLAPTASRSVLGFMNDIAFHCRHHVVSSGGLDAADVRDLNHYLRRVLHCRAGVYVSPIELVGQRSGGPPSRPLR